MVSSLRDASFLCPKPMKEKGKVRRWRKTGEGGGSIFRYPSMDSYALVLGAIHPPIGPSSLRSVGETDRWVDTSSNVSCSALSSTLPYIRYFCSISRQRSLWENFQRIQKRNRKFSNVSHSPLLRHPHCIFCSLNVASIFRVICLHYLFQKRFIDICARLCLYISFNTHE